MAKQVRKRYLTAEQSMALQEWIQQHPGLSDVSTAEQASQELGFPVSKGAAAKRRQELGLFGPRGKKGNRARLMSPTPSTRSERSLEEQRLRDALYQTIHTLLEALK